MRVTGGCRRLGAVLLLAAAPNLAACGAMYEDTKGWANRLEASMIEAANNFSEGNEKPGNQHSGLEWAGDEQATDAAGPSGAGIVQVTAASMVTPSKPASAGPQDTKAKAPAEPVPSGQAEAQQVAMAVDPTGPSPSATSVSNPPKPLLKPIKEAKGPKTQTADAQPKAAEKPARKTKLLVHLSSLRSERAARKEWEALKRAFPDQLSGMDVSFVRAELTGRGVFYRVLAGPLPSKRAASEVCSSLKEKKQYCQVMTEAPPG